MAKVTYNAKEYAIKKRLHPFADQASKLRKGMGDRMFPVFADKMIETVRFNRKRREDQKSRGA